MAKYYLLSDGRKIGIDGSTKSVEDLHKWARENNIGLSEYYKYETKKGNIINVPRWSVERARALDYPDMQGAVNISDREEKQLSENLFNRVASGELTVKNPLGKGKDVTRTVAEPDALKVVRYEPPVKKEEPKKEEPSLPMYLQEPLNNFQAVERDIQDLSVSRPPDDYPNELAIWKKDWDATVNRAGLYEEQYLSRATGLTKAQREYKEEQKDWAEKYPLLAMLYQLPLGFNSLFERTASLPHMGNPNADTSHGWGYARSEGMMEGLAEAGQGWRDWGAGFYSLGHYLPMTVATLMTMAAPPTALATVPVIGLTIPQTVMATTLILGAASATSDEWRKMYMNDGFLSTKEQIAGIMKGVIESATEYLGEAFQVKSFYNAYKLGGRAGLDTAVKQAVTKALYPTLAQYAKAGALMEVSELGEELASEIGSIVTDNVVLGIPAPGPEEMKQRLRDIAVQTFYGTILQGGALQALTVSQSAIQARKLNALSDAKLGWSSPKIALDAINQLKELDFTTSRETAIKAAKLLVTKDAAMNPKAKQVVNQAIANVIDATNQYDVLTAQNLYLEEKAVRNEVEELSWRQAQLERGEQTPQAEQRVSDLEYLIEDANTRLETILQKEMENEQQTEILGIMREGNKLEQKARKSNKQALAKLAKTEEYKNATAEEKVAMATKVGHENYKANTLYDKAETKYKDADLYKLRQTAEYKQAEPEAQAQMEEAEFKRIQSAAEAEFKAARDEAISKLQEEQKTPKTAPKEATEGAEVVPDIVDQLVAKREVLKKEKRDINKELNEHRKLVEKLATQMWDAIAGRGSYPDPEKAAEQKQAYHDVKQRQKENSRKLNEIGTEIAKERAAAKKAEREAQKPKKKVDKKDTKKDTAESEDKDGQKDKERTPGNQRQDTKSDEQQRDDRGESAGTGQADRQGGQDEGGEAGAEEKPKQRKTYVKTKSGGKTRVFEATRTEGEWIYYTNERGTESRTKRNPRTQTTNDPLVYRKWKSEHANRSRGAQRAAQKRDRRLTMSQKVLDSMPNLAALQGRVFPPGEAGDFKNVFIPGYGPLCRESKNDQEWTYDTIYENSIPTPEGAQASRDADYKPILEAAEKELDRWYDGRQTQDTDYWDDAQKAQEEIEYYEKELDKATTEEERQLIRQKLTELDGRVFDDYTEAEQMEMEEAESDGVELNDQGYPASWDEVGTDTRTKSEALQETLPTIPDKTADDALLGMVKSHILSIIRKDRTTTVNFKDGKQLVINHITQEAMLTEAGRTGVMYAGRTQGEKGKNVYTAIVDLVDGLNQGNRTLFHESFHVVWKLFLNSEQISYINKYYRVKGNKGELVRKYVVTRQGTEMALYWTKEQFNALNRERQAEALEEGAAYGFEHWLGSRTDTAPTTMIGKLWQRLADAIRHALVKLNLASQNAKLTDIFHAVASDKLTGQGEQGAEATEQARYKQIEEKNLVTIHNLSGDKLQKVFRMGGLPMPSLAVLDIEKGGHDQFGEVSLIGGEDILSASRKSPVYMADAWTPQYPDVVYQINPGQQETIKAITKIVNGINKDWKAVEELEVEQNIQKHGLEKALYLAFKRAYGREGWNPGRTAEDYREIERKSTSKARQIAKKYPVQTTEAIRTGFNINGNRKYRPHTLDNVVKEMERQKKVNDGTPTGLNELIGRMSPAMNSINSVKKNRDRILSNKEYQEARAKLEQEFDALVEYAKEHRKSDWWWYEPMQVMSDIYDIFNGRYSQIKQDYDGETDFGKFREVINRIRTLPTDYFEGKPRRVVAINEFAGAVIPTNADKGLAKSLKDAGLKVYKYDAGNDQSRYETTKQASEELGIRYKPLPAENAALDMMHSRGRSFLDAKMPNRITKDGLNNLISKNLKNDELLSFMLPEFVSQAGEMITKQEMMDWLDNNEMKLSVKRLSGNDTQYEKWTLKSGTDYREYLFTTPRLGGYDAPHFTDKNILMHMRLADMDGGLLIEEIQSDYFQALRKQKLKSELPYSKFHEFLLKYAIIEASLKGMDTLYWTTGDTQRERYNIQRPEEDDRPRSGWIWQDWYDGNGDPYVYDTRQDAWYDGTERVARSESFKWIDKDAFILYDGGITIDEVAENIYDIDYEFIIDAVIGRSNTYLYVDEDGDYVMTYRESEIPAGARAIGLKEDADVEGLYYDSNIVYRGDGQGDGEGMSGFYDKIIPEYLDKLGKKYGAKSETHNIKLHKFSIPQAMKDDVLKEGLPRYKTVPTYTELGNEYMMKKEKGLNAGGKLIRQIYSAMVREAGIQFISSDIDRGGLHSPAGADGAPLWDLTFNGVYPDDVYSFNGRRYYGTGDDVKDITAYNHISELEGRPNRTIKIYRAVDYDYNGKINPGDWVTTVRSYAREHGEAHIPKGYKIISKTVTARDLFTEGNSWLEWGYNPQPRIPSPFNNGKLKDISTIRNTIRYKPVPNAAEVAEAERQYAEVEAKYRGTDGWLKAPNGKPSNLNERQWVQVRTQNFMRKYGDWLNDPENATKAIDENGEPLVVWHGASDIYEQITAFDLNRRGGNTGAASAKMAFFFAKDEFTASRYAANLIEESSDIAGAGMPTIIKFLRFAQNKGMRDADFWLERAEGTGRIVSEDDLVSGDVADIMYDTIDRLVGDLEFAMDYEITPEAQEMIDSVRAVQEMLGGVNTIDAKNMGAYFLNVKNPITHDYQNTEDHRSIRDVKYARLLADGIKNGNDGAIMTNTFDGGGLTDIYAVFLPSQIDSATDNTGLFSEADDTRYKELTQSEAERQYAEVEAKYRGTDAWLKAPNGKPSNLNERQWVQVRTQAFKDWFGDWENDPANASKVVDENGEPRVMYHGTLMSDSVFKTGYVNPWHDWKGEEGTEFGHFFTDEKKLAGDYTYDADGGNVYPVFLSLKNPAQFYEITEVTKPEYEKHLRDLGVNIETDTWSVEDTFDLWELLEDRPGTQAFKDAGYDGTIHREGLKGEHQTYVVFDSEQIKSATANVGTFDQSNPDIRYKKLDPILEQVLDDLERERFGRSKPATPSRTATSTLPPEEKPEERPQPTTTRPPNQNKSQRPGQNKPPTEAEIDALSERIGRDLGIVPAQVKEKLGRQIIAAWREAEGDVSRLMENAAIRNFGEWVEKNKPEGTNNRDLIWHWEEMLEYAEKAGLSQQQISEMAKSDRFDATAIGINLFQQMNYTGKMLVETEATLSDRSWGTPQERELMERQYGILQAKFDELQAAYTRQASEAGTVLWTRRQNKAEYLQNLVAASKATESKINRAALELDDMRRELDELERAISDLEKSFDLLLQVMDSRKYKEYGDMTGEELEAEKQRQAERIQDMKNRANHLIYAIEQKIETMQADQARQTETQAQMRKMRQSGRKARVIDIVERKPDVHDWFRAAWYNAVLAGPMTHTINMTANIINSVLEDVITLMSNPAAAGPQVAEQMRALFQKDGAFAKAKQELRSPNEFHRKNQVILKGNKLFQGIQFSTKLLGAEDMLAFFPNERGMLKSLAVWESRETGRSVADLMENPTAEMLAQAHYEAKRNTFNQNPEGYVGVLIGAIEKFYSTLDQSGPGGKALGNLIRANFIPFTRVLGNVLNSTIDYTPLGLIRYYAYKSENPDSLLNKQRKNANGQALWKDENGEPIVSPYRMRDAKRQAARVAFGTILGSLLYALTMISDDDDEDKWFISGAGPRDYKKYKQLMLSGWRPYSLHIGKYIISYKEWPLSGALSVIGNLHDIQKYDGKNKPQDWLDQTIYAAMGVASSFLDRSFASTAISAITALDRGDPKWVKRSLTGMTTSSLIPYNNMFRFIENVYNRDVYTPETIGQQIWSSTPLMPKKGLPRRVNVFGVYEQKDPVTARLAMSDNVGLVVPDKKKTREIFKLVRKNNLWLSETNKRELRVDRYVGKRGVAEGDKKYIWLDATDTEKIRVLRGTEYVRLLNEGSNYNRIKKYDKNGDKDKLSALLSKLGKEATAYATEEVLNEYRRNDKMQKKYTTYNKSKEEE